MALPKSCRRFTKRRDIATVFCLCLCTRLMEIDGAILAFLISAGGDARQVFRDRGFHRPHERMNRTKHENRSLLVPTRFAQGLARVFRWMRVERPSGVG